MIDLFNNSNIYLIIFVMLWGFSLIIYKKVKKQYDAGFIILASFLLYSIFSLLLYNDPFYKSEFGKLKLFPFIYLFSMIILTCLPIFKYDQNKIVKIQRPSKLLINSLAYFIILNSILYIPENIGRVYSGFILMMMDSSAGLDVYKETLENMSQSGMGTTISNIPGVFTNLFSDISKLLLFYYLTLNDKKNKFIIIGLSITAVWSMFNGVALSQRGIVINCAMTILISYYAVKRFINKKYEKTIKSIGLGLVILISIPFVAITIARFDRSSEGGLLSSVYFYAGQENLIFNEYGLDNNGLRHGDRTFPMFKRALGFDNVPNNFFERRAKYPNLRVNDEHFIGYVGDFTLDYGGFVTPFIFLFFTLIFIRMTKVKSGNLLFSQLLIIHFVMCICFQGGMKLFSYADTGNLKIILVFILSLLFYIDYLSQNNRSTKNVNR